MTRAAALTVALATAGCALGPDYKRPTVPMTGSFRGQARAEASSFADQPWWDVYRDPALKALVAEALQNNFQLQDAVARVQTAMENAHISTDQLLPSISIQGNPSYQQAFFGLSLPGGPLGNPRYSSYQVQGLLSWEVDLWGRLRRLREAQYAQFFAAEDNRRGVIVSLIAGVAQTYFTLLALDLQRDVTRQTVQSRQEMLQLFREREVGGVGDALDRTSEEAQLANARANLAAIERQIVQIENQLCLLVGRVPGPIARVSDLATRPPPPDQAAGLPVTLLERRPDVHQAEEQLVSANAQVGAAFAALFPNISISAAGGVGSASLTDLFTGNAATFLVALSANWLTPVLNGAQNVHRHRAQEAVFRQVLADYRNTVLNALAEVSNALAATKTYRTQREHLDVEVRAQRERLRLAQLRFRNGVASYLDVVQAEESLYAAELLLAQTISAQFGATIDLYRALGGGWSVPPQDKAAKR
jgi:multidrug efflux system outer membrane protein